jgi:hypothetical protein
VRNSNFVAGSTMAVMTAASQCVPVTAGASYRLMAQTFVPGGQGLGGAWLGLVFYNSAQCQGSVSGTAESSQARATEVWTTVQASAAAPPSAQSVRFRLVVEKPQAQASMSALFDNVLFKKQ